MRNPTSILKLTQCSFTPRAKPSVTQCSGYAFSLVEMLVVIAIITLLISITLPGLGKAKEEAIRTKCASRLRQLHIASMNFADEHNGEFPKRSNGTFMPHVVKSTGFDLNESLIDRYLGVRDPEVFCPGALYEARNPRVFAGYVETYITYQYHNYQGNTWMVPKPDLTRNTRGGSEALWSCLTTLKNSGNWLAHDSAEIARDPKGQNAALMDGSARWFSFDKMEIYVNVSSHEFYWPIP